MLPVLCPNSALAVCVRIGNSAISSTAGSRTKPPSTPLKLTNIITRSGTNNFHGSGWDFLRKNAMDAKSFFADSAEWLHRNQFGGTVGEPIKKNRTFFFGYYEGLRNSQGQTKHTVPSLPEISAISAPRERTRTATPTILTQQEIASLREAPATQLARFTTCSFSRFHKHSRLINSRSSIASPATSATTLNPSPDSKKVVGRNTKWNRKIPGPPMPLNALSFSDRIAQISTISPQGMSNPYELRFASHEVL
jgi:hypothetical protein